LALPSATDLPSILPVTPLPVTEAKSIASLVAIPRSFAPMTMAAASGCSLDFSKLAAKGKISASDNPAAGTMAVTRLVSASPC
jgi:hypothetical protein